MFRGAVHSQNLASTLTTELCDRVTELYELRDALAEELGWPHPQRPALSFEPRAADVTQAQRSRFEARRARAQRIDVARAELIGGVGASVGVASTLAHPSALDARRPPDVSVLEAAPILGAYLAGAAGATYFVYRAAGGRIHTGLTRRPSSFQIDFQRLAHDLGAESATDILPPEQRKTQTSAPGAAIEKHGKPTVSEEVIDLRRVVETHLRRAFHCLFELNLNPYGPSRRLLSPLFGRPGHAGMQKELLQLTGSAAVADYRVRWGIDRDDKPLGSETADSTEQAVHQLAARETVHDVMQMLGRLHAPSFDASTLTFDTGSL